MRTIHGELEYIQEIKGVDNRLDKSVIITVTGKDLVLKERNISEFHYQIGPLGFINSPARGAIFVARTPIREDWRQGLRDKQIVSPYIDEYSREYSSRNFIFCNIPYLNNCIKKVYPKFDDKLLEEIEENGVGQAFDANYAVSSNFNLFFKHHKVGKVSSNGKIKLDQANFFLENQLQGITENYELA
jgi:hypothetical protein